MTDQWVLKINMSKKSFDDFISDANKNYGGHYWFKISMENKLSKVIFDYSSKDIQAQIDKIRMELVEMINKKYKRS